MHCFCDVVSRCDGRLHVKNEDVVCLFVVLLIDDTNESRLKWFTTVRMLHRYHILNAAYFSLINNLIIPMSAIIASFLPSRHITTVVRADRRRCSNRPRPWSHQQRMGFGTWMDSLS